MIEFRWTAWNLEKCEKHRVSPIDVEAVVRRAKPPYPEQIDDGKWLVWGATAFGMYLQVIYLLDPDRTIFVIHAMPLSEKQKRQYRRRYR
jgi:uncharacterized DUF497 family protein